MCNWALIVSTTIKNYIIPPPPPPHRPATANNFAHHQNQRTKNNSYKKLDVYAKSRQLVVTVYSLLKHFPAEEKYALCDQLRRAVISILSNIAEGSGRTSAKDQAHFFEMAFGSLMELSCQMDIACDLGYIEQLELTQVEEQAHRIAAMLSGLRRKCLTR